MVVGADRHFAAILLRDVRIDFTPKPCRCWSSRFVVRRLLSASFLSRES